MGAIYTKITIHYVIRISKGSWRDENEQKIPVKSKQKRYVHARNRHDAEKSSKFLWYVNKCRERHSKAQKTSSWKEKNGEEEKAETSLL